MSRNSPKYGYSGPHVGPGGPIEAGLMVLFLGILPIVLILMGLGLVVYGVGKWIVSKVP